MSIAENKSLVMGFLAAQNSADEQRLAELLSEDFVFQTMARSPEWLKIRWTKRQYLDAAKPNRSVFKTPLKLEVVNVIAEGNTVSIEACVDADLVNGKHYDNAYNMVFVLDEGKIQQLREYSCSHLAAECFAGGQTQSNKDASHP